MRAPWSARNASWEPAWLLLRFEKVFNHNLDLFFPSVAISYFENHLPSGEAGDEKSL